MPVEILSFHMKPWNFFTQNPTIDLPPSRNKATLDHDESVRAGAGNSSSIAAAACCAAPAADAPAAAGVACCSKPAPPPQQPLSRL